MPSLRKLATASALACASSLAISASLMASAASASSSPNPNDGLLGRQSPTSFAVGAYPQGLALLGVAAANLGGQPAAKAAANWLVRQQCPDGGWQYYRADLSQPCAASDPTTFSGEDTNSTAVAAMALVALGVTPTHNPTAFLEQAQSKKDGGFPVFLGGTPDPDSTGLVTQALIALGVDPTSVKTKTGKTPYDALLGFQLGCSAPANERGALFFPGSSLPNSLATAQGVPALAGTPFPLPIEPTSSSAPAMPCPGGAADPISAATFGATWLATQIGPAGYISGPGGAPDYGTTESAVLALAATKTNAGALSRAEAFLSAHVDVAVKDKAGLDQVGQLGQLAMAAKATAASPTALATRILANCMGNCGAATTPTPSGSPSPKRLAATTSASGAELPFTGAPLAAIAALALLLLGAGAIARTCARR